MLRSKPCQFRHDPSLRPQFLNDNRWDAGLQFFRGEHAWDSREVVGYANVGPDGCVEAWLHRGQAIMAEFEDQDATGLKMPSCFCDETGIKFITFLTPVKRDFRFVFADFAHQCESFTAADIRRIADNQIKRRWLVTHDW